MLLPSKLLAIREAYGASQSQLGRAIGVTNMGRMSEYEHGMREPNLITLLAYARVAHVTVEQLIDDQVNLAQFQSILTKKARLIEKRLRFVLRRVVTR